jgi:hypothetical protein
MFFRTQAFYNKEQRKPKLSFLNSNRNLQSNKILSNELQDEKNNNEIIQETHNETHNETPDKIYDEKNNNDDNDDNNNDIIDINDIETINLHEIPKPTVKPPPDDTNRWYNIFKRRKSRKVSPSNYRAGKKTKRRKNRTKRRKNRTKRRKNIIKKR